MAFLCSKFGETFRGPDTDSIDASLDIAALYFSDSAILAGWFGAVLQNQTESSRKLVGVKRPGAVLLVAGDHELAVGDGAEESNAAPLFP